MTAQAGASFCASATWHVRLTLLGLGVCAALCALGPLAHPAHAQPPAPKDPATIEAELAGDAPAPSTPTAPAEPVTPVLPDAVVPVPDVVPAPHAVPAPVIHDPRASEVLRLREIDAELTAVSDDLVRVRIGAPLVGMIAGYAGGALLSSIALANTVDGSAATAIGVGVGAGVLLGVGMAGHLRLRANLPQRRALQQRLARLRLERLTLTGADASRRAARARLERLLTVQEELGSLRSEYARLGLAGPLVVMIGGFAISLPLFAVGLVAAAFNDESAPLFGVAGLAALAVGGGGALWLGHRRRQRKPLGARIRELQTEERDLVPMSFNVQLDQRGANLTLQLRF